MAKEYNFIHDGVKYVFTTEAQESPIKTKLAGGRKVFEDREVCYARVPSPGAPKQENSDLITPDWLAMKDGEGLTDTPHNTFRDHYDRWKAGLDAVQRGTPLEDLAELTPAMIKTLEASKIETLEAMVAVDAQGITAMLGPKGRDILAKAKALLASFNPDVEAVRAENLRMSTDLEALKAQIAQLQEARAAAPEPKGRKAQVAQQPADAA